MGSSQIKWRLDITTFRSVHFCKVHTKLQRQQRQVQSPLPPVQPPSRYAHATSAPTSITISNVRSTVVANGLLQGTRWQGAWTVVGRCCWQALSLVYWSQTGSASHTHTHTHARRSVEGCVGVGRGKGVCVYYTHLATCVYNCESI